MIYVYAICDPVRTVPRGSGVEGCPLELLKGGSVDGVFSTLASVEIQPTPELLWAHERVIEQIMRRGAVLPIRFGTTLKDAEAFRAVLRKNARRFRELLGRVRGCVELGVRVGLPESNGASPADGGDYLRGKVVVERRLRDATSRALAPLAQFSRESCVRAPRSAKREVSASYLVAEDGVRQFVREVVRLQSSNPHLVLSCTGPWAPYSFVEEEPQ